MSKLIPSREAMDDFVILLKRYLSACRVCFQFNADRGEGQGQRALIGNLGNL